ncbi:MAG TPA: thiamine phosphate synthase [Deltaproteobacteria bacterium]|nr:thiamine phosphate synthase [Deltaproteobacteria bacterium]HQB38542.1 thiamine phosphate synthase [Deltaproteobacteria bacterium]
MSVLTLQQEPDESAVVSPLYLITDRSQGGDRPLSEVVESALRGGVRMFQLREKDLADAELFCLADELARLVHGYGGRLLINRRADVCVAVGADGVQLGADGPDIRDVRRLLGTAALIGYSAHGLDEALRAERCGADFITFSPVFHTPSKAIYGPPVGLDLLSQVCERLTIPVLALGGIKPENLPEVMNCGAAGVALISAVMSAADPAGQSALILEMIKQHAIQA